MPKPKNAMPVRRLLRIASVLLMSPEPLTRDELWRRLPEDYPESPSPAPAACKKAFERNERKWSRDKNALKEAGIPIRIHKGDTEQEEAYVVDPREYLLPETALTADELSALRIAGAAASRLPGHPWALELESALRKLRWLGDEEHPEASRTRVAFPARELAADESEFVAVLRGALRSRKSVTLRYRSASREEPTVRTVDVYGIAWRRGMWLFAGHCHLRNALRVFYPARVERLSVNPCQPGTPDYEVPPGFDIHVFSQQQPWDYWAHAPIDVEVVFHASNAIRPIGAALIAQQLPGATVTAQPECVLARVTARDLDSLLRHVFSLGLDAEIRAPESARAAARRMLARMASGGGA